MVRLLKYTLISAIFLLPAIFPLVHCRFVKKNKIDVDTPSALTKASSNQKDAAISTFPTRTSSSILKDLKREVRSAKENDESEEEDEASEEQEEEVNENEEESGTVIAEFMETTTVYSLSETDSPGTTIAITASTEDDYVKNWWERQIRNSVHLEVILEVREVTDIDETAEIITMVISGRIYWNTTDEFNKNHFYPSKRDEAQIIAKPEFFQKMWKPNIKFRQNAKVPKKKFMNEPSSFLYDDDWEQMVYFITNQTVQFKCQMDFKYYPADIQNCNFNIITFNKDKLVTMVWYRIIGIGLEDNNFAVQLKSYEGVEKLAYANLSYDAYEELQFTISMRREIGYHVVQTYLPSILYILITCLCFLVPSHMVEVRIGITMTTLLTLTAMFGSVRQSTPTVSYITAIDIWMAFCIFFVFLTLLEFTTLLWMRYKREAAEKKRLENQKMLNAIRNVIGGKSVAGPVNGLLERRFSVESLRYSRHERFSENVEKYGFFVFLFVFLTFNVVYWSWLIEASKYHKWAINETLNKENR